MTVTGAGRSAARSAASSDRADTGFGLSPERAALPGLASGNRPQEVRFSALDGLRGLAVPFILAFALRSEIAGLNPPAAVQYLADGGFVLINLCFVLAGFLLCRPLAAILAAAGSRTDQGILGFAAAVARGIAPLHLLAWLITFGWLVTGTSPGSVWSWMSSALLLNGLVGPATSGYPMSWSISAGLGALVLLVLVATVAGRPWGRLRPRRRHLVRPGAIVPTSGPGGRLTGIALVSAAIGTAALILTGPNAVGADAVGTVGMPALGQALLGLAIGMLCFRVLEGATGTLKAPRPGSIPVLRSVPGVGSILALSALVFCVYRSDLVYELNLLPVYATAAVLVYLLALPHESGRTPVNRLLDTGPLQWLGARALALFLLLGPVLLTVQKICTMADFDRTLPAVRYGLPVATVLAALIAADLGHRLLERRLAPPAPGPAPAISPYRVPRPRPERVGTIDPEEIPRELRLKPLPQKAAATPRRSPHPATGAVTATARLQPATAPGHDAPVGAATVPTAVNAIEPPNDANAEPTSAEAATSASRAPRKTVRKTATKPAAKPGARTTRPTTKSTDSRPAPKPGPAPKPTAPTAPGRSSTPDTVELPPDKPARKSAPRKQAAKEAGKPTGQPIDLDHASDYRILDADADHTLLPDTVIDADDKTLDADRT